MRSILLVLTCAFSLVTSAQLVTYQAPPSALINSSFLGQDYVISNIEYTGHASAIGQFIGTNSNLGLTNGIVLTTGKVLENEDGPIGPNNTGSSGMDNGMSGYYRLNNLANDDTYNASVLEFDFIPSVDSISLKYVFGSDEYPEFVNAGYNDVFAFFISGPGLENVSNIAVIPNSPNIGVTIDNVNDSTNFEFYVNNGNGSQSPQNDSDFYIQYDGFTSGLTASADLMIGETYHFIIAIADVGDGAYDSGLFIEKCATCAYHAGIAEEQIKQVSIYPNPSKGFINIKFKNKFSGELTIYDCIGNMVQIISIDSKETAIDLHELTNGVYQFAFSDGKSVQYEKIVISQ